MLGHGVTDECLLGLVRSAALLALKGAPVGILVHFGRVLVQVATRAKAFLAHVALEKTHLVVHQPDVLGQMIGLTEHGTAQLASMLVDACR